MLWSLIVQGVADRPHWFVGDTQLGQELWWNICQSLRELTVEHRFGVLRFALLQRLTHAKDRIQARGECALYLLIDERIGFA